MIVAERVADLIRVSAPPTYKDILTRIPGAKYRDGVWWTPLSWAACLQLRSELGALLDVGPELAAWGHTYVSRRAHIRAIQAGTLATCNPDPRLSHLQAQAVAWMSQVGRCLMVTEMRTGKTPMTIETLEVIGSAAFPALLVVPNTTKFVWADEFAEWAPGVATWVLHGTAAQRRKTLESAGMEAALGHAVAVITNWESLKGLSRLEGYGSVELTEKEKTRGPLNEIGFRTVVLDEAHKAVNPKAKQTMAAKFLAHEATYRICLTGTPVVNNGGDLQSLWNIIAPEESPVRTSWISRYCVAGEGRFGFEIFGFRSDRQAEMFEILEPRFMRRTLREMRPGMPDRLPMEVRRVRLEGKQEKVYRDLKKNMLAVLKDSAGADGVLVVADPLTLTGQLSYAAAATPVLDSAGRVESLAEPSIKVDVLREVLSEYPGESLVVFTVSRKLAELVERCLAKDGTSYVSLHGGVDPQLRAANIARFQLGEAQVCICTAGAGAEGITLNRARRTLFLQVPWSNAQFTQAQARTDGLTGGDPIETIVSLVDGTIEQAALDATDKKEGYLQEVLRDHLREGK